MRPCLLGVRIVFDDNAFGVIGKGVDGEGQGW